MNKLKLLIITFFIAVFVKQVLWLGLVPLWHFPDEPSHFGQVEKTVYFGLFKEVATGDQIILSQQILDVYRDDMGKNKFTHHSEYNIPYSNSYEGFREAELKNLNKDFSNNLRIFDNTPYPFLYYFITSFFYKIFSNSDIINKVFFSRLSSVLILLITTWICFKIGKIIFNKDKPAIILAGLVSFQPMFSYVGAGINSDILFNFWFTLFLYSCLLVINEKYKNGIAVILLSIAGGVITKQQMAIAFFILPFVLIFKYKFFLNLFKKNKLKSGITILILNTGKVFLSLLTRQSFPFTRNISGRMTMK